jgi:hypothetical protein
VPAPSLSRGAWLFPVFHLKFGVRRLDCAFKLSGAQLRKFDSIAKTKRSQACALQMRISQFAEDETRMERRWIRLLHPFRVRGFFGGSLSRPVGPGLGISPLQGEDWIRNITPSGWKLGIMKFGMFFPQAEGLPFHSLGQRPRKKKRFFGGSLSRPVGPGLGISPLQGEDWIRNATLSG